MWSSPNRRRLVHFLQLGFVWLLTAVQIPYLGKYMGRSELLPSQVGGKCYTLVALSGIFCAGNNETLRPHAGFPSGDSVRGTAGFPKECIQACIHSPAECSHPLTLCNDEIRNCEFFVCLLND